MDLCRQDGLVSLLNQVGSAKDDKIRSDPGEVSKNIWRKQPRNEQMRMILVKKIFRDLTNRPETPQFWQLFGSGKWDPG